MKIHEPEQSQVPQLHSLWKQAFGDEERFLDTFFAFGFSPDRCRCLTEAGRILAALYWFDVETAGQKQAYLYAVATEESSRGRGFCRKLMADTHAHLSSRGYTGAMLVPEGEGLAAMYARMGYRYAGGQNRFTCPAGPRPADLWRVSSEEYAALRRSLLPENGVVQEGSSLDFQGALMEFFAGEGMLLAAYEENGALHCPELLGDISAAGAAVKALNCREGYFRVPGGERHFAMFLPFSENAAEPGYFGIAFD